MTIDIIIQAPTKAALLNFAKVNKLATVDDDDGIHLRKGFKYCLWASDGKFKTKNGTYDVEGNQLTAPKYAAGVVAIFRFDHRFFFNRTSTVDGEQVTTKEYDAIEVDPTADNSEQHTRSRIARHIRNKGVKGKTGPINHWALDGAKLFRLDDVKNFVEANGLPPHTWGGGNQG